MCERESDQIIFCLEKRKKKASIPGAFCAARLPFIRSDEKFPRVTVKIFYEVQYGIYSRVIFRPAKQFWNFARVVPKVAAWLYCVKLGGERLSKEDLIQSALPWSQIPLFIQQNILYDLLKLQNLALRRFPDEFGIIAASQVLWAEFTVAFNYLLCLPFKAFFFVIYSLALILSPTLPNLLELILGRYEALDFFFFIRICGTIDSET